MAKIENWNYLVNALPMKKSKESFEDKFETLHKWFFSETPSSQYCAEIAYRDLCRTLEYSKTTTSLAGFSKEDQESYENGKKKFCKDIYEYIGSEIEKLIDNPESQYNEISVEGFDGWHKEKCEEIIKRANDADAILQNAKLKLFKNSGEKVCFHYGQAQKWINMTFKNMLVAEKAHWYDKLKKIRSELHVPVDNYILAAAYNQLGIRKIEINGRKQNLSTSGWSKWDYTYYKAFQDRVRDELKNREDYRRKCPIDWEFDAWMTIKGE